MILGPNGQPVSPALSLPQSYEHAFDAARRSGYRGFFYFPSLEPSQQMPTFTREEIARKANWLYNNVGAVSLVIDGLGLDEVDTGIWPKATTSNPAFNREVTAAFDEECGDARVFDEAAVQNYYSAQLAIRRHIRMHGELFAQELRPGQGSAAPSMNFVPMYQIGNATTKLDQSRWREGVMVNRHNRPLMYRVLTNRERTAWMDVSADDMLHFHDHFWVGQLRGTSGLAPVVKKLFSIDDITRAETNGVLLRARLAYAITRKDDGFGTPTLPGVSSTEEVETPDGGKLIVQKIVSPYGDEVDVADLSGGRDIKVLESSRAISTMDFTKTLLTDVAYCTLYPPEYVFFMGGIGQGTLARLVLLRVRRVKNTVRQFQLIPQFCKRWYTFWLWQLIRSGRFDKVGVPSDWYKVKHICPADDTVDIGREGKMHDARLETGKMSPEEYHGINGHDADDVEDEIIAARIRRERKIIEARAANPDIAGLLTHDAIFSPPAGRGNPQPLQPEKEEEED